MRIETAAGRHGVPAAGLPAVLGQLEARADWDRDRAPRGRPYRLLPEPSTEAAPGTSAPADPP